MSATLVAVSSESTCLSCADQSTFTPFLAMRKWGMVMMPLLEMAEIARVSSTGATETDWPNDMAATLAPSYSSRERTMPVFSPGKSMPDAWPIS